MPMERDKHESLLAEMMGQPTETRKAEILQELRTDYSVVLTDHTKLSETSSQLAKDKDDLLLANSRLFRQNGVFLDNKEEDTKVKDQTFSESVTLETLLK